ncbi:indigoidine synthase A family protein [Salpingoeca rosetta]|uniref:Indigoidine synthase A family protein n=1 Tax=Salpingoeca rosetta (strain ATCC 50818 / BSB-021) TaxID=946362 RepID=F2TVQ5_SALR5|nr:indigoidine synthase A family protein [Salpingoeca rosetta]EGD72151.1 indigoidine synthase A family protein [Salpingoeca rosetta]|eukprot:XP_004998723.1 indigoidine synthase A family protein [Salpingoeca rosetta]
MMQRLWAGQHRSARCVQQAILTWRTAVAGTVAASATIPGSPATGCHRCHSHQRQQQKQQTPLRPHLHHQRQPGVRLLSTAAKIGQKHPLLDVSEEVLQAQQDGRPVVALESTIISHGMPFPDNVETALAVEECVRHEGCIPATIGIMNGRIRVGMNEDDIHLLANAKEVTKASRRDMAYVLSQGKLGATTVAGTMIAAHMARIPVFVTGGLGGVHRDGHVTMDVSADITELGRTPVAVVCSGVKSILDIGRTLEALETQGVFVATIGRQREFPAFFAAKSAHMAPYSLPSEEEAAKCLHSHLSLGVSSGLVFAVPVPAQHDLGKDVDAAIEDGLAAAKAANVMGKEVTPFLLQFVNKATQGRSLATNIELIKNNARTGARIARSHAALTHTRRSYATTTTSAASANDQQQRGTRPPAVVGFGGAVCDIISKFHSDEVVSSSTNYGAVALSCGGVARNVAAAAAKHMRARGSGTSRGGVGLVTSLGADLLGDVIAKDAHAAGNMHLVLPQVGNARTAVYNAILDNDGNLKFAIADMTALDCLQATLLDDARVLQALDAADVWFADCNCDERLLHRLHALADPSTLLWIEPTSIIKSQRVLALDVWGQHMHAHTHTASSSSARVVLSPDVHEFAHILRELPHQSAHTRVDPNTADAQAVLNIVQDELLPRYPNVTWVVTLGPDGVVAPSPSTTWSETPTRYSHYATKPLTRVENVTGAGDTLAGAMLACAAENRASTVGAAVRAGIAAATALLTASV